MTIDAQSPAVLVDEARNGREVPITVDEGRRRTIVEGVQPQIDGGRYPIKRIVGDTVVVEADCFADGHDVLSCAVLYRREGAGQWQVAPMAFLINDRWRGSFVVESVGRYEYTVASWIDRFKTWEHAMEKRIAANQDVRVDLLIGADLVDEAAEHAPAEAAATLRSYAAVLRAGGDEAAQRAVEPALGQLMAAHLPRRFMTSYEPILRITVDRERAAFSSWYSIFPRSTASTPGTHGTFKDVENWLPYIAAMGFDVLYLTPIHPIGRTFRKGKDNNPVAQPGDPGSPYAIGSAEGGYKDIHPELGTLEDFRQLVARARDFGLEIALDNAFNASPEHPYVSEHPEWFRARPDGTIQYAENPPKKYQDIYPFDFETSKWRELWVELKSYFDFWIDQGVKIFRVDNPHTKAFRFWEWCIDAIKREHPDVIFLSEAFTRPKVMYNLAKLGFTQSYTYFTWRTAKWELTQYMVELTQGEPREFFRPNFWPNTHDILTPQFYAGHRSTFLARFTLAATLTSNYGIYGPSYEQMLHTPVGPREEYIDNEKYEIRHWNLQQPGSLAPFIARVNHVRREHPALQRNDGLRFHTVNSDFAENDQLIAYSKRSTDGRDIVLIIVNLDPINTQSGWVQLPLAEWGIAEDQPYEVYDQISGARYSWYGAWNFVAINPNQMPVHLFVVNGGA
jgi:starch synthase (maltosyl-transferring)